MEINFFSTFLSTNGEWAKKSLLFRALAAILVFIFQINKFFQIEPSDLLTRLLICSFASKILSFFEAFLSYSPMVEAASSTTKQSTLSKGDQTKIYAVEQYSNLEKSLKVALRVLIEFYKQTKLL